MFDCFMYFRYVMIYFSFLYSKVNSGVYVALNFYQIVEIGNILFQTLVYETWLFHIRVYH